MLRTSTDRRRLLALAWLAALGGLVGRGEGAALAGDGGGPTGGLADGGPNGDGLADGGPNGDGLADGDSNGGGRAEGGASDGGDGAAAPDARVRSNGDTGQMCRILEVAFQPAADDLQLAVWLEDSAAKFVSTLFITRATGTFGIGNRPGRYDLYSGFRWPYGRRTNVLPIWAHRHGGIYPKILFADERDGSVAYHEEDSSTEPYFCRPTQPSENYCFKVSPTQPCVNIQYPPTSSQGPAPAPLQNVTVDAITCPTPGGGTLSKGWYRTKDDGSPDLSDGNTTVYPPRNDLTVFTSRDNPVTKTYSALNTLDAVSRATPPASQVFTIKAPLTVPDGDYLVYVEANREFDANDSFKANNYPDDEQIWRTYGAPNLGQPSVLYKVPISIRRGQMLSASSLEFVGYGDPTGDTGKVSPPDGKMTTDKPGSGAWRLAVLHDTDGSSYRVKVTTVMGSADAIAPAVENFDVAQANPGNVNLAITVPMEMVGMTMSDVMGFELRYRAGEPITADNFDSSTPVADVPVGTPGQAVMVNVGNLRPQTHYFFAVRTIGSCGQVSALAFTDVETPNTPYSTLQGCFVATASYGSVLDPAIDALRAVRDGWLLKTPRGRSFVSAYYAVSPRFSGYIAGDEDLRRVVRSLLVPIVRTSQLLVSLGLVRKET